MQVGASNNCYNKRYSMEVYVLQCSRIFCFILSFPVRLCRQLNYVEVFARLRALGWMKSKIIKVGFEISFGTRILIFLCPLYLCTVGRDKSRMSMNWRACIPVSATGHRLYQPLGLLLQSPHLLFKVHTKILSLGW